MENNRFDIFYPLLFIFLVFLSCQSTAYYAEIPFTLENKRIVVEATANGTKGRFVFDTGSTESYIKIETINLPQDGLGITSYNGEQITVPIYNLNKISFGDVKLKTHFHVITHSDLITRSQRDGFDGILGAGVFDGYWCELSFSKSKIILHKKKPDYFTNFSPVKILSSYNADFFIPVIIDGETFYFDIDTGSPAGLYFPSALVKIKELNEYREVLSTDRDPAAFFLVKTDSIYILDEIYTEYFVMTNSFYSDRTDEAYHNFGVLGIDFLKYYDFLFDCRKLSEGKSTGMYYESNTPIEDRNYGIYSFVKKIPEFGILNTTGFNEFGFVIHRILKDSMAYKVFGLRPGMTITKINEKPITGISREELFDPLFYLTVDSYTILNDNIERTILSPLKDGTGKVRY